MYKAIISNDYMISCVEMLATQARYSYTEEEKQEYKKMIRQLVMEALKTDWELAYILQKKLDTSFLMNNNKIICQIN